MLSLFRKTPESKYRSLEKASITLLNQQNRSRAHPKMSNRNAYDHITLGLIVSILVWASIAYYVIPFLNYTHKNEYYYFAEKCAEIKKRYPLQSTPLQSFPAIEENSLKLNSRQATPNWCDLAAQFSVADSTVWMKWAAIATTGLTVIGILLLWRTLRQTDLSLREAERTAAAAHETVAVTREIGHAQARCYLDVKIDIAVAPGLYIQVFVNNTGQSPAEIIDFFAEFEISLNEKIISRFQNKKPEPLKKDADPNQVRFIGNTAPLEAIFRHHDWSQDLAMVSGNEQQNRETCFYKATVIIEYLDVFKQRERMQRVIRTSYSSEELVTDPIRDPPIITPMASTSDKD